MGSELESFYSWDGGPELVCQYSRQVCHTQNALQSFRGGSRRRVLL
jgi:hypothetical protein